MDKLKNVFKYINEDEVISFLQALIQLNSVNPPGNELAVANLVAEKLKSYGVNSQLQTIAENRANVIGLIEGKGDKPALLLNGHLDTVPPGETPWKYSPFSGEIVDGKMYGRGAADMKSGLAAITLAACILKKADVTLQGTLLVTGTAGEESDSIGAKLLAEKGLPENLGAMVIAEPTSLQVCSAHKGCLWLELTTFGQVSHGSMPELGVNAIEHMNLVITELKKEKWANRSHALLGQPTINIATINGGVKTNVVPDRCILTIDFRLVPGQDPQEITAKVEDILARLRTDVPNFQAELKVINERVPVESKSEEAIIKAALQVKKALGHKDLDIYGVNYYTDASIFVPATRVPAVIIGPGPAGQAHQLDEYVEIEKLLEAVKFYIALSMEMLG
jgi:succinyl-diaminopimelate desuccinylase